MLRFIKYILLIFFGILLILYLLDSIYSYVYSNSNPRNKISYLISQRSEHINYIFIGSSRVDNTINTDIIEKATGKSALNLGIQASKPSDYLLILKLLEDLEITSDYVFIQMDHSFNLDNNSNILNSYLVPYNNYKSIEEHLNATMDDYWSVKFIPFYKFLKYDYQIGFREFFSSVIGKEIKIELSNGFHPKRGYSGVPLKARLSEKIANRNKFVDSIFSYQKRKNMNIIYFTAPYCPGTSNIDFITKLTEKFEIFWNFSQEINSEDYFYDCLHLNENGANLFSKKITIKIKNLNAEN